MKILEFIKRKTWSIKESCRRFPESTLLTLLLTIITIIAIETKNDIDVYRNLAMAFLIGLVLMTALKLLLERLNKGLLWMVGVDITVTSFIIMMFIYLPDTLNTSVITVYLSLLASFVLAFVVIPYFYSRELFGFYSLRVFLNFFLTAFYSLVLFAGISGLVFAVERLFEISFSNEIYLDILVASGGFFGFIYFLSTIENIDDNHKPSMYPKGIRILLGNILIPLTMAYSLIMYLYFIRILLTRQWANGIVGHLVIWFGIMAFMTVFLLDGIELKKRWQNLWMKYFPFIFIMPFIMLCITMGIRIQQYGFTMLRYYVMMGVIWFMIALIMTLLKYENKTMFFILSGMLILLVSSIGPISSVNVSYKSQSSRLEKILEENNILSNGQLQANESVDQTDIRRISSILIYIDSIDMTDELVYLPENFDLNIGGKRTLGFEINQYTNGYDRRYYYYQSVDKMAYPISGQVYVFRYQDDYEFLIGDLSIIMDGERLVINDGEFILEISQDFSEMIENYGYDERVLQEDMVFDYKIGDDNLKIILDELVLEYDGEFRIDRACGIFIVE